MAICKQCHQAHDQLVNAVQLVAPQAAPIPKPNFLAALCCFVMLLSGCSESEEPVSAAVPVASWVPAESIYFNGEIITMNDLQPEAEAVAVLDGKIVMAGDYADAKAHADGHTRWIDLAGKTLLPGFFDAHSHATLTAAKLAVVNTDPPPAGSANSITSIQRALRDGLASAPPEVGEWLIGWGYDNAMLEEGRHPTRDDLDKVSLTVPIVLIHFSSHQVVLNSKGLELADISADSEDPEGGRILRFSDSREPNGILQENAQYPVVLPILDGLLAGGADVAAGEAPGESALQRMDYALQEYAAAGFTTVTEMGASRLSMALLQEMARQQRLPLDVIAFGFNKIFTVEQISALYAEDYRNHFRVGGLKVVLDGGSPGRTAYLREPYFKQFSGEKDYRGYPHIQNQAELNALVESNYRAGTPVHIHALGDAALDQAIEAVQAAETAVPGEGRRTQLIHIQQAQGDQLDKLAKLDVTLTFQVAHNFYFGDFHRDFIYGPARTARLNPAREALDRGLSVTIHHDSPVHPIDQMMLIWASVNRVTRTGKVIGPEQKITVMDALKASTLSAAYQFSEEDTKGSIETGKLADFVILSDNPLTVDPMMLKDILVMETIKEGKTIHRKGS
ncbi:MAG: amidohydrolase [Gammaproteobacteria bacterium]|nr:amidohydrolase [Gammaproteobacteria bacterium]